MVTGEHNDWPTVLSHGVALGGPMERTRSSRFSVECALAHRGRGLTKDDGSDGGNLLNVQKLS